jgi:prolyl-tRNA editing enzyme YbaK/EbsC (Cys-tRNA(Pro) deacylase)
MNHKLSKSAQKVQAALASHGLDGQVLELPASTKTSEEAADAVGCDVGQIAKALVFMGKKTGKPFLVIASGANRVNEKRLKDLVSEPVRMAKPEFVREKTGFAIGGVPPISHTQPIQTFIDRDLFEQEEIWAAAGTPHALFKLTPMELKRITRGEVTAVT